MADVGFNVLSPWTGSERGWKTYLAKSGSRLYKGNGKKSIKLMGAQRAWWALSGRSKGRGKENSSRRPPKGIEDMEIDSLKDRGLTGDHREFPAGPQKPGEGILKKGGRALEEAESGRHALAATPFGFLLRGLRAEVSEKGSVGEPLCSEEPLHFGMSLLEVGMYLSCFGMYLSCFGMYLSCFGMILSCFDMVLRLHVGKWFAAGVFCCSSSFAQNPQRTDRTRHHVGMFSGMLLRMFALLGCLELAAAAPFGTSCFHDFSHNGYGRTGFCRRVHPYSRGRGLGAEYRSTELTPLSGGSGERRSAEPSNPGFFATIRFWACSSERGSKAACSFESGCSGSFESECACSFESECAGSFGSECACSFGSECACSFGSECACSFGSECACSFGSECACSFGSGCDCSFDSGCYGCSSGPCFSSGDGGFRFLGAAVARGWPILKEVQGFPWDSSARHTIQRCCWFGGAGNDGSQLKCWGAVADPCFEGRIGAPLARSCSDWWAGPTKSRGRRASAPLLTLLRSSSGGTNVRQCGNAGGSRLLAEDFKQSCWSLGWQCWGWRCSRHHWSGEASLSQRDGRRDASDSTDFLSTFPGTSGGAEGGEAAGHRPVDPDARGSRSLEPLASSVPDWERFDGIRGDPGGPYSSQGPRDEDGPALAKAGQALEAAAATGGPAVSFALFANGRTVPVVVHPLSHGVCWIDWRNVFEAARASARSLPIGSEEGMGSDRMLGLCSYGCFAAEGERTASAPEGAVVNQGRQCEKRSPTEIAVVLGIIEFFWRGERVFIRTRRTRSFWKAINHACLWWENLADGRAAPRLCAWHARPLGGKSCPTGSGAQAAAVDPPSPTSMAASLAPGEAIASTFGLPRVPPVMDRFQLAGVPVPPDVTARRRLLTPPRAPPNFGQTEEERSFVLPSPVAGPSGSSAVPPASPEHSYEAIVESANKSIQEAHRLLEEQAEDASAPQAAQSGPMRAHQWTFLSGTVCLPRPVRVSFSRSVLLALRQQRGVEKCVSLGMLVVSMFCGMIGMTLCRLRPRTPQTFLPKEPRTPQTFLPKEPQAFNTTAAFRNGFTPGLDVGIVAFLMTVYSFLWGLGFWVCSGILRFFRMLGLEKRRLRRVRFLPRRKESFLRIKVRDHWVRVSRDMKLSVLRRQPTCFESMLSCFAHVWHACVAWHVEGDDESTQAEEEPLRHRLRAVRGLPLPGKGSASDPFRVDPEEPARPAPLSKPSEPDVDDDLMPPAAPRQKSKPSLEEPPPDPNGPEDDEDLRVPLSSVSLCNHRSRGHFPFDSNCESCCASKGRVPARRLRRKLQRENQTIGLD